MSSFLNQLKQRRVYRIAIGYAIAAWLAVQIAATVLPAFHASLRPPTAWFRGEIAMARGDAATAKAAFADARRDLIALYGDAPSDPFQLAALARADALAGRPNEAVIEARRAVELRPISTDTIAGAWLRSAWQRSTAGPATPSKQLTSSNSWRRCRQASPAAS
jgi:hypothetical protein